MTLNGSTSVKSNLLSDLEELAIVAGAAIMLVRQKGVQAKTKSDLSPVTEADEMAENIILSGLAKRYPTIPIVAEEATASGLIAPTLGDRFFLVDPLDGTKEFISGREDFTVNIALIEFGIPVAGVVYAPAHGTIYSGDGNFSAKGEVVGGKICAATPLVGSQKGEVTRVVASRSHMTPETEAFLNDIPNCATVNVGSSLKFCLLAEGKADLYPRFGRTMEWDTAAGDAILRAVGGSTVTLDGKVLIYGKRNQENESDFANPYFISKVANY